MAPVEVRPVAGGPTVVLDAGVPWPRTPAEVEREWARAAARVAQIADAGKRETSELTSPERYAIGAWVAARWSRAEVVHSPVLRVAQPVTGRLIRQELAV